MTHIGRSNDVECVQRLRRLSAVSGALSALVSLPRVLGLGRKKVQLRYVRTKRTVVIRIRGNTRGGRVEYRSGHSLILCFVLVHR